MKTSLKNRIKTDPPSSRRSNQSLFSWFMEVSASQKRWIILLSILLMGVSLNSVLFAWLFRCIIDAAVEQHQREFIRFSLFLLLFYLLQILLRFFIRHLKESTRSAIENQLKSRLFQTLLSGDYAYITRIHNGEWMNRLSSDAVVVADGLTLILPEVLGMMVKMIGAVVMLIVLLPKAVFLLLPGIALMLLFTYVFRKKLKSLHRDQQEAEGKSRILLLDRLTNLLVVRSFSREESSLAEANEKFASHRRIRLKRNRFANFCNAGFGAVMDGAYMAGVVYCGFCILNGSLSLGTLAAVMQLVSAIQSPAAGITGYIPKYYAMLSSAERLRESEAYPPDCTDPKLLPEEVHALYRDAFRGIRFEEVSFRYPTPLQEERAPSVQRGLVLEHLSLSLRKGEFIALTGRSGCGKSTLFKLMLALYHPDEGKILCELENDGEIEYNQLTPSYRGFFAYVPQGNQLMSGTIRESVVFGDREKLRSEEEIWSALKTACAEDFVRSFPQGLDTPLGEGGRGLSEGQLQRLAIARAVFSKRPILLLDEATSSLDEKTEADLLCNLKQMTDSTVLIITHRPAALAVCDQQIALQES